MLADHYQNQHHNQQPLPPPNQGPGNIPVLPAPLPQPNLQQPQSPVALTTADIIGEAGFNFGSQPPPVPMVGPANPDQAAAAFAAGGQPLPPMNYQQGPPPPPVVTVAALVDGANPQNIPQNLVVGGRSVSGARSPSGNQTGPPPQPEIPPPPGAIRIPPAQPGPVDPFQDPLGQALPPQQQQPQQPQRTNGTTPAIVGLGPLIQPTPAGPPQTIPAAPPTQLQSPPAIAVGGGGGGGQVQEPDLSQHFPFGPGPQMVTGTIDTLFNRDQRQ